MKETVKDEVLHVFCIESMYSYCVIQNTVPVCLVFRNARSCENGVTDFLEYDQSPVETDPQYCAINSQPVRVFECGTVSHTIVVCCMSQSLYYDADIRLGDLTSF